MLESLAREYVETVDALRYGVLDISVLHQLEGDRAVLHEQLASLLHIRHASGMYQMAQRILLAAQAGGAW